jgi:hypothetical protein
VTDDDAYEEAVRAEKRFVAGLQRALELIEMRARTISFSRHGVHPEFGDATLLDAYIDLRTELVRVAGHDYAGPRSFAIPP